MTAFDMAGFRLGLIGQAKPAHRGPIFADEDPATPVAPRCMNINKVSRRLSQRVSLS